VYGNHTIEFKVARQLALVKGVFTDAPIKLQGQIHCGITMDSMVGCCTVVIILSLTDSLAGLIRYRIVIHAFVDGFSRFVVGIQVVNNNQAKTVVNLFHHARARHGTPSRVRGDHGVKNILVAAAMEDIQGSHRGSYIWGQ
jgi:hypothetical protein